MAGDTGAVCNYSGARRIHGAVGWRRCGFRTEPVIRERAFRGACFVGNLVYLSCFSIRWQIYAADDPMIEDKSDSPFCIVDRNPFRIFCRCSLGFVEKWLHGDSVEAYCGTSYIIGLSKPSG